MIINIFAVCKLLGPTLNALAVVALIPTLYALVSHTIGASVFFMMATIAFIVGRILSFIGKHGSHNQSQIQMVLTIRELFHHLYVGVDRLY